MPKEKNYNPVQAQRKADKAKAIKKGKAEQQDRRNEKFARKNPERIQKQVDDLKAITTNGGKLSKHEGQLLEGLEKELRSVNKAREALGDQAPSFGRGGFNRDGGGRSGVLGKRRRGSQSSSSGDEVPEDVRRIPMPRDTPPPIPKNVMDTWWTKRRARRAAENPTDGKDKDGPVATAPAETRTVYEAKPVVRDLQKEAVAAFVPTVVRRKLDKGQGQGGLLEPEEADQLESEGYMKTATEQAQPTSGRAVTMEEVGDDED